MIIGLDIFEKFNLLSKSVSFYYCLFISENCVLSYIYYKFIIMNEEVLNKYEFFKK